MNKMMEFLEKRVMPVSYTHLKFFLFPFPISNLPATSYNVVITESRGGEPYETNTLPVHDVR